mgnify:CR=1 FL=1
MERIIELDRLIYKFGEDRETKIMLIKELVNGEEIWKLTGKCWEYSLWHTIGERGGLAEAGELVFLEEGKEKNIKIEEYVKIYRDAFLNNQIPVEEIFDKFEIKAVAWIDKSIDDKEKPYAYKKITEDFELKQVKEDEFKIYYELEVNSVENLYKMPVSYGRHDWDVTLLFMLK